MAALNALKVKTAGARRNSPQEDPRDDLIGNHIPQIRFIARSIAARYCPDVDLDDLISAGYVGLLDALEKFDDSKGIQFKTYAEFRIRGAILDRLRSLDPVPKWLRQKGRQIEQACRRLEQRLGRQAAQGELADELGMEFEKLQSILCRLSARDVSVLDDSEHREETPLDRLLPSHGASPYDDCFRREVRGILEERIGRLPEREQQVLSLRYREDLSMKEIGKVLNVHQSRVSQLHNKAVRTLRSAIPHHLLEGFPVSA